MIFEEHQHLLTSALPPSIDEIASLNILFEIC